MEYTNLDRTGLTVGRLCLGAMNLGPRTSEDDSHTIMDRALELGTSFFDTANRYGRTVSLGQTEEIILYQMHHVDTLAQLDEIWPGPGGEAPEAYAW